MVKRSDQTIEASIDDSITKSDEKLANFGGKITKCDEKFSNFVGETTKFDGATAKCDGKSNQI